MDVAGEPIIGASVLVKGSSTGSVTDIDGKFSVEAPVGSTLVVSFVGYATEEVKVGTASDYTVTLKDDTQSLSEVVVTAMGIKKAKKALGYSVSDINSKELMKNKQTNVVNSLDGKIPGVNITQAGGAAGAGSNIVIRGGNSASESRDNQPLFVVDGIIYDNSTVNTGNSGTDGMTKTATTFSNRVMDINPEDIESMSVLKGAAAAALYGSRAANGVILVTTKKGKMGKAQINYNFSYGWQSAWKRRDVTSATDYAILQNEANVNGGQAPIYADPYNLIDANGNSIKGFGTDWQDLVFYDNAPVVNHDVTVSGASEKVNYYLSLGYDTQEGIVGGNHGHSNYDRLTIRSNTQYNLIDASKERVFLNKLELVVILAYMRTHSSVVGTNSEFGSILCSALYLSPILTPTLTGDAAEKMIDTYKDFDLPRDANGDPYTVPGYGGAYQEMNNPLAMMPLTPTKNWPHTFVPKFSINLQLWDNLKYHFKYTADMGFSGKEGATKSKYYLSANNKATHTNASSFKAQNVTWQIENTLTYDKTIGKHTFGVVLGQSALKYKGDQLGGNRWSLVNPNKPSIDYATGNVEYTKDADGNITGATVQYGVYGGPYTEHRMSSMFARLSYNYNERYMIQATIRRDGSSRFGINNKYGTFPSVSVGWNVTNEEFMADTREC